MNSIQLIIITIIIMITIWYNYDALLKYCNKVLQNYFAEGINKRRLAYVFSWSTSTSLTIRHNRRVSEGYNKRGREPSTRYERAPKALIKITNGKSARVSAALAETSPARLVIQPPFLFPDTRPAPSARRTC